MPILEYLNMGMRRSFEEVSILMANVMWTMSLIELIKQQGFVPLQYGAWPTLRGRLVLDGLRRVSICAALGMESIEVENTIQADYLWWSQAFKVGESWIDVSFPPDYERKPGSRQECQNTWSAFSPHLRVEGKSVLDLGCGPGFFCHRAVDAKAASVTGIDRDRSILQTTNANLVQDVISQAQDVAWLCGYDKKIEFVVADLNKWQTEQQWDIVFALRAHYHMADPVRFLNLATNCAKEALVIQCNPTHGIEAGTVEFTQAILASLWEHVALVLHGQLPILVCKEKKHGN
jgi:2-polyprenyl-3-methyl-5-hydroxy-6-metoxy-1,4-benzoquinol methylase